MERKRVKGYHVAAALLLLWAAADFYHCFYSGGNLIAYYLDLSNVRPLLGNKLFRGIVKTALGWSSSPSAGFAARRSRGPGP